MSTALFWCCILLSPLAFLSSHPSMLFVEGCVCIFGFACDWYLPSSVSIIKQVWWRPWTRQVLRLTSRGRQRKYANTFAFMVLGGTLIQSDSQSIQEINQNILDMFLCLWRNNILSLFVLPHVNSKRGKPKKIFWPSLVFLWTYNGS